MSSYSNQPWTIKYLFNVFSDGRLVASCGGHSNNMNNQQVHDENVANARLIAQAPSMLKELKDMMWLANAAMLDANKCGCEYEIDEELKEARAIIRAAEGEE